MPKIVTPGPASYNIAESIANANNDIETDEFVHKDSQNREKSKMYKLLRKGPARIALGDIIIPSAKMHIPVFGSQTERFENPSNIGRNEIPQI